MIRKSNIALVVILISLLLVFETFTLTPLGRMAKTLSMGGGLAGFALYAVYYRRYPKALRQFVNFFLFLFVSSVLSANLIYGQGIRAGIAANGSIISSGLCILSFYLIRKYKFNIQHLLNYSVYIGWALLLIYLAILMSDIKFGATNESGDEFGIESLRKGFVNLVMIIFLVRYFKSNKFYHLLFALIFFSVNEWGDFQRYILLVFLMSIGLLVFFNRKRLAGIKIILASIIIVPMTILFLMNTSLGRTIDQKMTSALEVVSSDDRDLSEASVAARIWETQIALESIQKYPIFGVGKVRSDVLEKKTGNRYFFISDIGLLGILYAFGIVGIILFLKQLVYMFRYLLSQKLFQNSYNTEMAVFLFFVIVHSFLTGRSILMPAEFIMIVVFLEAGKIAYNEDQLQTDQG